MTLNHRLTYLSSKADTQYYWSTHTHAHTQILFRRCSTLSITQTFKSLQLVQLRCVPAQTYTHALAFHSQDKQTHKPLTVHFLSICWEQFEANRQINQYEEIIRAINDQLISLIQLWHTEILSQTPVRGCHIPVFFLLLLHRNQLIIGCLTFSRSH